MDTITVEQAWARIADARSGVLYVLQVLKKYSSDRAEQAWGRYLDYMTREKHCQDRLTDPSKSEFWWIVSKCTGLTYDATYKLLESESDHVAYVEQDQSDEDAEFWHPNFVSADVVAAVRETSFEQLLAAGVEFSEETSPGDAELISDAPQLTPRTAPMSANPEKLWERKHDSQWRLHQMSEQKRSVAQRIMAGQAVGQIASEMGISQQRVYALVNEMVEGLWATEPEYADWSLIEWTETAAQWRDIEIIRYQWRLRYVVLKTIREHGRTRRAAAEVKKMMGVVEDFRMVERCQAWGGGRWSKSEYLAEFFPERVEKK